MINPFINKILQGDVLKQLKLLPDKSVQTVVTSPPYWGLRNYGVKGQIGLEKTPELYVKKIVKIFREVRRVLKDDGTIWLNMGDSYSGGARNRTKQQVVAHSTLASTRTQEQSMHQINKVTKGLKPKDLVGIPWMVAFALRNDGWYLRQDIIWSKPNAMPESVNDRCTKAHEYIFLLTKKRKYYYDSEAIATPIKESTILRSKGNWNLNKSSKSQEYVANGIYGRDSKTINIKLAEKINAGAAEKANKRSVWEVPTKPFNENHFAIFPPELITDCIKAGSRKDDTVLDIFLGSGTTAEVARSLDRNFIGIELNPSYIKIAHKRLFTAFGMFCPDLTIKRIII